MIRYIPKEIQKMWIIQLPEKKLYYRIGCEVFAVAIADWFSINGTKAIVFYISNTNSVATAEFIESIANDMLAKGFTKPDSFDPADYPENSDFMEFLRERGMA